MEKVFIENPSLKECFKTSDGQYFYNQNDAKNHAKTLEDKSVEHLTRASEEDDQDAGVVDPKAEEIKKVKKLNKEPLIEYAKENYPDVEILEDDNKEKVLNKVLAAIEVAFAPKED